MPFAIACLMAAPHSLASARRCSTGADCRQALLTIRLRDVAASPDAQADVHVLKPLLAQQQQGLLDLVPQRLGLQQLYRRACAKLVASAAIIQDLEAVSQPHR